jgi:hypothetical protein
MLLPACSSRHESISSYTFWWLRHSAVARYLGFARVTDTVRQSMKSAINSGIRQGILTYEGDVIWRE